MAYEEGPLIRMIRERIQRVRQRIQEIRERIRQRIGR